MNDFVKGLDLLGDANAEGLTWRTSDVSDFPTEKLHRFKKMHSVIMIQHTAVLRMISVK